MGQKNWFLKVFDGRLLKNIDDFDNLLIADSKVTEYISLVLFRDYAQFLRAITILIVRRCGGGFPGCDA